ncbi:hypothetical protein U6B65_01785 [Oscillospiraceae bacterium MB08-C2-2]|nr:hypothetical protein U6B65_01785 [Oscillospiraceae bacterium MB08-C2-2]
MQNEDRWLTTNEVCGDLSSSRQTRTFWIEANEFPAVKAVKFGRNKQDEFDGWIPHSKKYGSGREV